VGGLKSPTAGNPMKPAKPLLQIWERRRRRKTHLNLLPDPFM
jgi:hypothetical protein